MPLEAAITTGQKTQQCTLEGSDQDWFIPGKEQIDFYK